MGTHVGRQLRCQGGHLFLGRLQLPTKLPNLLRKEERERQAADGRGRLLRLKSECVAVLKKQRQRLCILPQIASSPQPGEVGTEGERERQKKQVVTMENRRRSRGPNVRAETGRSVIDRCREESPPGPGSSELHSGLSTRLLSGAHL